MTDPSVVREFTVRAELGLPLDRPILEEIARRPRDEAAALHRRLEEIEVEIAHGSRPQPGASAILTALSQAGARLGILTRNSERIARITLKASGLSEFGFPEMAELFASDLLPEHQSSVRIIIRTTVETREK